MVGYLAIYSAGKNVNVQSVLVACYEIGSNILSIINSAIQTQQEANEIILELYF